jgi:hypothetical protein
MPPAKKAKKLKTQFRCTWVYYRKDYALICDSMLETILLQVLDRWCEEHAEVYKGDRWVRASTETLNENIYGHGNRRAITKAIDTLMAKGFLERKKHPAKKIDNVWLYNIVTAEVEKAAEPFRSNP